MARRVLITGATGFIGKALAPRLLARGYCVAGLGRRAPGPEWDAGAEYYECDLSGAARDVARVVWDFSPEAVVHLAANVPAHGSAEGWDLLKAAAWAARNLFAACGRVPRLPKVIVASSSAVYGACLPGEAISERRPLSPASLYGVSKALVEMLSIRAEKTAGIPVVRVRLFNVIGPGQRGEHVASAFAKQIALLAAGPGEGEVLVGNLDSWRDFVDVRDVADAFGILVERGRRRSVYNICSGRATRIGKVLHLLIASAGLNGKVRVREREPLPELVPYQCGDMGKLRRAGWRPRISLRSTLADLLAEFTAEQKRK
ncbi:MAG: NAD-dependent epimerase/dehydratase family protein [Candidatus Tectomicrobia bacterium]|uniref:NAD-dependent epimerase/dehydratase family protein n=1 Tax=Tectimicrobiota bacterium TaxID=2528274 RepID=A0A932HXA0_UNCTE|nr:NAD-dependent epimerase/dehydratase family protein [Candidatus Tectomicrobia bacterium]